MRARSISGCDAVVWYSRGRPLHTVRTTHPHGYAVTHGNVSMCMCCHSMLWAALEPWPHGENPGTACNSMAPTPLRPSLHPL